MSWKTEARKSYQARILNDTLDRLEAQFDVKSLPFSENELQTLARRTRESVRGREEQRRKLEKYKAHLSAMYGRESVEAVSAALASISSAIGYEEK